MAPDSKPDDEGMIRSYGDVGFMAEQDGHINGEDGKYIYVTDGPIITDEEEAFLLAEREHTGESEVSQSTRLFRENAPAAVKTIIMLAKHGKSERTRLQAATYVVERILGRVQDNPPTNEDNPYDKLVAECVMFVNEQEAVASTEGEPETTTVQSAALDASIAVQKALEAKNNAQG